MTNIVLTEEVLRRFFNHLFPKEKQRPLEIDYHCVICGKNVEGMVRIENTKAGYVKCLGHGLGVTKVRNQP